MIRLLTVLVALPSALGADYCLAKDPKPYNMFGTHTSYEFVHGADADTYVPNCHPVFIWFIARHGAIYPKLEVAKRLLKMGELRDEIVKNHRRNMGHLCLEDLDNLKSWEMNFDTGESQKLMPQGYSDTLHLGKRLKNTFRGIFDEKYSPDRFTFKSGQTQRTEESAKALAEGIFGQGMLNVSKDKNHNHFVSRDKNCPYWTERDSYRDRTEENKFKESEVVKELVARVSRRLGFFYNLTFETLLDMWEICEDDKAMNYAVVSPWCATFEPEDLRIMEYFEDLSYYHSLGYGQEAILKMGCPILKDMMERLSNLTKNTTDWGRAPKGVFYTVHRTMLAALLVKLGIGKPLEPLTSKNFLEMSRRPWRNSKLIPFSGNLAAILFKCNNKEFNVMLFENERVLDYPGCNSGLCDWMPFYEKFQEIMNSSTCNFDFCHKGAPPAITGNASSSKTYCWLISFVLVLWRAQAQNTFL